MMVEKQRKLQPYQSCSTRNSHVVDTVCPHEGRRVNEAASITKGGDDDDDNDDDDMARGRGGCLYQD